MAGLAPQLTLEAAIAQAGGFRGIAAGQEVAALLYLRLGKGDGGDRLARLADNLEIEPVQQDQADREQRD